MCSNLSLKEYYEIVDEARLLSGFFPHMLICLQKYIFNHETKQASEFQSDSNSNCFTIEVRKIKCWLSTVYYSNVDCEAIRARITLKLGRLLSFMIRKKSACVGKNPDEGRLHRSHSIPLSLNKLIITFIKLKIL